MNNQGTVLRERVERIMKNGLEDKTVVERISKQRIKDSGKLIQIRTGSSVGKDGGINDYIAFDLPVYDCGHASRGRKNFGGMDYKGNVACIRCFKRCIACQRPLCLNKTVRSINGFAYCPWHSKIRKVKNAVSWTLGLTKKKVKK